MRHEPTIAMLFNFGLESLMYLENKNKNKIRSERSVACLELRDVKQVYILCCVYSFNDIGCLASLLEFPFDQVE
jgi:hypothetical protein